MRVALLLADTSAQVYSVTHVSDDQTDGIVQRTRAAAGITRAQTASVQYTRAPPAASLMESSACRCVPDCVLKKTTRVMGCLMATMPRSSPDVKGKT